MENFHEELRHKINSYVHEVYAVSRGFPKEEMYGITSQLRRAALSVALNYIEGYARFRAGVHKNFIEIAYGSLQESKYLLQFSFEEKYMSEEEYKKLFELAEDIGKMLWGMLRNMNREM
ncbi:MAG: four helix bundle protein [Candidatus Brennerbacteria bacterium CG11_big_fil_rev_8_21_14_0_20_43_10]|uniref:Four helix bundle protein n=2 Tax=Candidatus Brenneribacteriota TaxID=1817902 RepID=A0A2H9N541_9BACT|nr:MAG: four helix bundle protein [Candidatus Brennerbacteria bacterium CG11_big_fil_rev_8_21_14_0_20_43_10]PIX28999.1 MAG: four helix bundle protein [Candidatus Brennerbacteria bacterium CG_4_8_14_3_um_filter_43_14]